MELAKRRRKRAASHTDEPTVPEAPTNLGMAISPSDFFLTWEDNSPGDEGFKVYRREFEDPFVLAADLPPNTTEFLDGNIDTGIVYTYYVVAYNGVGESAPSNEVSGELGGA